jgi:hypothetical protein
MIRKPKPLQLTITITPSGILGYLAHIAIGKTGHVQFSASAAPLLMNGIVREVDRAVKSAYPEEEAA